MSWYSQMLKSQEMVRERNRREERRQQGDKYGPQFVANYHLAALNKEKKLIEKELERIRKGIHKAPAFGETNKAKHILTVTSPRLLEPKHLIDPEYSKEEDHLYDAILFLQNNPSALVPILSAHAQSDAYLETLERIAPRITNESQSNKPFLPKYLVNKISKAEKADLLNKYETLLHRSSPILRRNSPLTKRKHANSPAKHRDSPLLHDGHAGKLAHKPGDEQEIHQDDNGDGNAGDGSAFFTESNECQLGTKTTTRTRQIISISQLALGSSMTTARENVATRLASKTNDTPSNAQQATSPSPSDDSQAGDDKKCRPKAIVMFPSVDPEVYNPDGTLRTVHNMPNFESRWEEAQKARYIRSKDLLERDRELSVQEIFEKP